MWKRLRDEQRRVLLGVTAASLATAGFLASDLPPVLASEAGGDDPSFTPHLGSSAYHAARGSGLGTFSGLSGASIAISSVSWHRLQYWMGIVNRDAAVEGCDQQAPERHGRQHRDSAMRCGSAPAHAMTTLGSPWM